jgi:hypothetical protein
MVQPCASSGERSRARFAAIRFAIPRGGADIAMSGKTKPEPSFAFHGLAAEIRDLFGMNLRQLRLTAKLTQVDLARRSGIQQHYLGDRKWLAQSLTGYALAGAVGADVRT